MSKQTFPPRITTMSIPSGPVQLQDTLIVSAYMKEMFPHVLKGDMKQPIQYPPSWSLEFALDVDRALDVLGRAFHNKVSTGWDVRRYTDHIGLKYSGINKDVEERLQNSFKPLESLKTNHLQIAPCTITDRHGNLLVWYLPNILRPERQESMFADLKMLEEILRMDPNSNNWRTSPQSYRSVIDGLEPGNMNISPAWFEQGHEVFYLPTVLQVFVSLIEQSEEYFLKVSSGLAKESPACQWLRKNRLPFALIGGIFSIIQPDLFDMGVQALQKLESNPGLCDNPGRLQEVLRFWHLPFSALSVISNRLSQLHCDTGGRAEWLDMLLALGKYDNGRFAVPLFGYTFKYNPGTIVALSSKIFRHGATCEGNRAAIAFYMRDNVLNRLGFPTGTWLQYQNLLSL